MTKSVACISRVLGEAMSLKHRRFLASSLVTLLLLLALILFAITLAIGTTGIVIATQDNVCHDDEKVGRGCIPVEEDLAADTNLTSLGMGLAEVVNNLNSSHDYLYWLIGATGSGLVFCIAGSFCVWASTRVLYSLYQPDDTNKELREVIVIETEQEEGSNVHAVNECGGIVLSNEEYLQYNKIIQMEILDNSTTQSQKWIKYNDEQRRQANCTENGSGCSEKIHLKKLSAGALICVCFSFLCGIVSILCLMWSFALGFNHSRRFEQTVTPFVVANILSGIVAPILFFVSIFILVNLVDYFTSHKIKAHLILTRFLPCLKYEDGVDIDGKVRQNWIVANSLVLKIQKNEFEHCMFPKKICSTYFNFCKMCLPNCSTILLSIIAILSLMIAFSYFIDITLVNQVTVASCSDPTINIQYSCFKAGTLNPVSCTSKKGTQRLHCFRFYRFGVDLDLITSIANAFAFYLFTNHIFTGFMLIIRFLHNFTRRQGEIFIVGGFLLLLLTGSISIVWIFGYASESVSLLAHLDVLNLAQLIMVSLFILIVGFLAYQGEWVETMSARQIHVRFKKEKMEEQTNTTV